MIKLHRWSVYHVTTMLLGKVSPFCFPERMWGKNCRISSLLQMAVERSLTADLSPAGKSLSSTCITSYGIPRIINITTDSTITNIRVWSHISLLPLEVNNTSVFNSFTSILLTVFPAAVSRGRSPPLWEQPSSQPLGSWPTSESMFQKGRVSPWARDGELERLLHGERATRKARGCRLHRPRQIANLRLCFPAPCNENKPA